MDGGWPAQSAARETGMETCTISQLWSKLNKQPEKNPHYIPLRNPQCQGSVFDVKFNLDHGLYFNWNWTVVVVVVVVGCWWRGGDLNSSKNRWSLALAAIKTNWPLLKWSTCKLSIRMSKSSLKMLTNLTDWPEYWDVSDRQQSQLIMTLDWADWKCDTDIYRENFLVLLRTFKHTHSSI